MEHFTVKQEDTGEEAMDISSGLIPDDYVGTGQLGGLEVEIDLMKGKLDGDKHNYVEIASSSGQMNQVSLITLSDSMQPGEQQQQLTIPNNQIVMASSGNGQSVVANKNQLVNNSQTVTKLVITKNTSDRSQCVLSVGPEDLQQIARNSVGQNLIGQPGVVTTPANSMENSIVVTQGLLTAQPAMLTTSMPVSSPTKTYVLSPQKHATAPIKYTVSTAAKLPVSPAKTSPKRTVISASSLQKSPQRVTQVPGRHQYMMLTCPPSANTSKVNTITMSPSKGTKGQAPVSIVNVQQPQYSTSQNQSLLQTSQPNNINMSNVPSNIRPVSVTGSKFQYVRLVAAPSTQKQTNQVSRPPTIAPAPQRVVTPAASQGPIKVAVPLNSSQPIHPKQSNQSQRLILPATSQPVNQGLQPAVQANTNTLLTSGVNAAQTINLQGLPGFALIQTQYIAQPQNQTQLSQPLQAKQDTYQATHQSNAAKHNTNGHSVTTESLVQRPRKPCNCTKSQCLKLYCDCFANGEFCSNCNCSNCYNNLDHEEERQRAIKTCLERNPHAFHPKIGKGRGGTGDRRHNKGCNCKRSGCLKNYCECYEAKIMCSSLCKCVGCKNYEESSDRKTLMHLADAAEVRHQQQTAVKTKLSTQIQELTPRQHPATAGERLPYTFVTAEVAEATCACLVAQAEEAERTRQQEMVEEKMILQEFGRCLMQVIQSATSTRAPSPVP